MSDRKRFIFRSVFNGDTLAYLWDNERWDYRNPGIHNPAAMFQTYGDGTCQHSQECGIGKELLADFLISLSAHLLENPADVEVTARRWPSAPSADRIAFFQKLRYDESKRRYYSSGDLKVSAAESKRNDRRWEEVPTSADGSLIGTLNLCLGSDRHSVLELLAVGLAVADNPDVYVRWDRKELLDWLGADTELNRQFIRAAFESVQLAVNAHDAKVQASGHAECLARNVERWNEKQAADKAEVAVA